MPDMLCVGQSAYIFQHIFKFESSDDDTSFTYFLFPRDAITKLLRNQRTHTSVIWWPVHRGSSRHRPWRRCTSHTLHCGWMVELYAATKKQCSS